MQEKIMRKKNVNFLTTKKLCKTFMNGYKNKG